VDRQERKRRNLRARLRKGCAERCHMRKSLWPGPGSSRSGGDINVLAYSPSLIALDSVGSHSISTLIRTAQWSREIRLSSSLAL
jgi:hypothetical protein